MTSMLARPEVRRVAAVDEAVALLAELGAEAAPLAGATWVMRAGLRGEPVARTHVALDGVAELRGIGGGDAVTVGAMTTHAELAAWPAPPALAALRQAAGLSAFPQVRNVATVGGNLGARGFAEADLVPALLALDARLRLAAPGGRTHTDVASWLAGRATRPAGELITGVELAASATSRSGYARLTVRGGGEYAIASVALAVELSGGVVSAARVALGSVEPVARRSPEAEEALVGGPLDAERARAAGAAAAAACRPRDGLDAPGWYRAAVLPALFERAAARAAGADSTEA